MARQGRIVCHDDVVAQDTIVRNMDTGHDPVVAADNGFATRFDALLENLVTSGGTIDRVTDGANARVQSIERQKASLELRLEKIEARYMIQFASLDTLMAEMTTTSNYLSSQLDGLSELFLNRD